MDVMDGGARLQCVGVVIGVNVAFCLLVQYGYGVLDVHILLVAL